MRLNDMLCSASALPLMTAEMLTMMTVDSNEIHTGRLKGYIWQIMSLLVCQCHTYTFSS